jgi:nitroimidazol reductase NimA-like FMN-containing flavoprotein (pyridoxamine 5'-phosphate oxidase superfamily)
MRLLAAEHIGHLGLTAKALPVVTPIRYRLFGESIVFATGSATELRAARNHAVACLGIAGVDQSAGTEWTVLATGRLREADHSSTWLGDQRLPPAWGAPAAKHFVVLDIELLHGCATRPH